jgi:hypothetical protein
MDNETAKHRYNPKRRGKLMADIKNTIGVAALIIGAAVFIPDRFIKSGSLLDNPCDEHTDFNGEVCPVCLMNERDALRLELKQVSARLLHADKEIDRLANENKNTKRRFIMQAMTDEDKKIIAEYMGWPHYKGNFYLLPNNDLEKHNFDLNDVGLVVAEMQKRGEWEHDFMDFVAGSHKWNYHQCIAWLFNAENFFLAFCEWRKGK